MLLSWVLSLQPEQPGPLPAGLGRAAHAWFLDRVRAVDPALAEELHGGQGLRPFTVSDPTTFQPPRSPGEGYRLRVTTFSPRLSSMVKERVWPALPETLLLAGTPFRVTASTTDPAEHPWAAEATFEGLVRQFTLAERVPRLVGLRFASPTAFRVTGKQSAVPLPLPALVFGGLLDRWNRFSPIQLHPDLRRFAEECLVVSSYRLETRRVTFGEQGEKGVLSGCVGQCRYYVEVPDRYWMGLIHLLAGFALYAGVGLRTTMGLGQVRRIDNR